MLYFNERGQREREKRFSLLSDSLTVSLTSESRTPTDDWPYYVNLVVQVDYRRLTDKPHVHPETIKVWFDGNRMQVRERGIGRCTARRGGPIAGTECHRVNLQFDPYLTDSIVKHDRGTGEAEVTIALDSLIEYRGAYVPIDTIRAVELKTDQWYQQ